jgi:hypothetical protein
MDGWMVDQEYSLMDDDVGIQCTREKVSKCKQENNDRKGWL